MPGLPTARVTDHHTCPMADVIGKPHVGGPVLPPAGATVSVRHLGVARLADMAACAGMPDVIAKGAATVLINGLPAVRVTDTTVHGGVIAGPGAIDVSIGGPAFEVPANFVILGGPGYQNKVVRDLYFLWTTPSGKELLRRLEASGETITFDPDVGTDGTRASPENGLFRYLGIPTGTTILYNPNISLMVLGQSNTWIPEPPQIVLGHELIHALNNAEGTRESGTEPKPPFFDPNMKESEAQTIGVGSHAGDYPTENSIRCELGLDERADHATWKPLPPPPPVNYRPGDPW